MDEIDRPEQSSLARVTNPSPVRNGFVGPPAVSRVVRNPLAFFAMGRGSRSPGCFGGALVAGVVAATVALASGVDPEVARQLDALGYAEFVDEDPRPQDFGVTVYDRDRVDPGVNVYCANYDKEVRFIDMEGRLIHRIELPARNERSGCLAKPFRGARMIVVNRPDLLVIGPDSEPVWKRTGAFHHDVAISDDGTLYTFSRKAGTLLDDPEGPPVLDHSIVRFDAAGNKLGTIELMPILGDRIDPKRRDRLTELFRQKKRETRQYQSLRDVFHPNTIEWLQKPLRGTERGDLLVCIRNMEMIAVIDSVQGDVVWRSAPGLLERPHHPSVLPNGNLLVFDNGFFRGHSRVVEIDPESGQIVWQYASEPPEDFFSGLRGSAYRLANGNTLITESGRGRVFEVTRAGEIVWEFRNPDVDPKSKRRHSIYRMLRLTPEEYAALRPAATSAPDRSGSP